MIEAIKEIGEYTIKKEDKSLEDFLIDDPANKNTKNILFIVIKTEYEGFKYERIDVEEYSKNKLEKYLYRKGASSGTDITPTAMITTIEKTFTNKILNWFHKYKEIISKDSTFLVEVGNCLEAKKEKILKDLKEKCSIENNIISLKINGRYVGEYEIFRNILVETAKKNFYFTKSFSGDNQYSKSENKICVVCNKEQPEVYGFVNTFKFYTVDKLGFVSGGFQQKNAWKNYPVCLNCALKLEAGKKYLGSKLNFAFYGFKYLLIPKFLDSINRSTQEDIFKLIEEQKDPKFRKKEINRLTQDETEIFELIGKQKNCLNLNFLFYDAPKGYNGSVFNILLYIEDILPSRLKTLFDEKTGNKEKNIRGVDKINIFRECMVPIFENRKRIGETPLEFNFGILRTFFPYKKDPITKKWVGYYKYFLDIVNKIFTDKPLDYNFLIHFIMKKIRDDFVNGYPTKISTLKGFMLLNYLKRLKLIKISGGGIMDKEKIDIFERGEEIDKKVSSFFNEFKGFFDNPAKKAVFLEGVLTQKLLNIQWLPEVSNAKPGKEPFRPRLKGLKLDEKQIKKLLPEIQNKLEEYGKNYYRNLESIISEYFASAGNGWKLTNDEISFYFVLGMNLAGRFKLKNKKGNNGEGDKNE